MMLLILVSLRATHATGLRWWAASDFVFACGFALIVSNDIFPRWVSGVFGNLLLDVGTGLTYGGMLRFLKRPRREAWPVFIALILGAIEFLWSVEHGLDYRVMTLVGCALRAILTGAAAWQLTRHADPEMRPASTYTARFYWVWMTLLLARIAWWLTFAATGQPVD